MKICKHCGVEYNSRNIIYCSKHCHNLSQVGKNIKKTTLNLMSKTWFKKGNSPKNKKNLVGKRFGRLVVIEETSERKNGGKVVYLCKCDCGNVVKKIGTKLTNGHTISCGCRKKEFLADYIDYTGHKIHTFGRTLEVVKRTNKRRFKSVIWEGRCEGCNKTIELDSQQIRRKQYSCGCKNGLDLFYDSLRIYPTDAYAGETIDRASKYLSDSYVKNNLTKTRLCSDNITPQTIIAKREQLLRHRNRETPGLRGSNSKHHEMSQMYERLFCGDIYIKSIISSRSIIGNKDVPPQLVELKRAEVQLKRKIREIKK